MSLSSDDEQYWTLFRERSLQPGGFGEDRARIWPALLGAQPLSDPPPYSEVDNPNEYGNMLEEGMDETVAEPHADERQIKLDTDRSFVLYPGESGATPARDALQNDLHTLIVSLFRKRRSLHYFQGFHDIMTVIFLTLPRPLHLACAEKMALHRVRDAMGVGLEPILGLLRVLRNLLRLADPAYAKLLELTSPLPYHALSHLLTLFSHDVPTLPLIQHVWDFLLSREPIAVVWLVAALILHRKPSVHLLAEQDEDGMIHSLLGGIPELVDAEPEFYDAGDNKGTATEVDRTAEDETVSANPVARSRSDSEGTGTLNEQPNSEAVDEILGTPHVSERTRVSCDTLTGGGHERDQSSAPRDTAQSNGTRQANSSSRSTEPIPLPEAIDQNCVDGPYRSTLELAASVPLPDSRPASPIPSPRPSPVQSTTPLSQETTFADDHHNPRPSTSDHVSSCSHSPSDLRCPSPVQSHVVSRPSSHLDKSVPSKPRIKTAPLSLTRLLRQADDLLAAYPPSHPSLHVTEIMGPDSAMRTWRALPISTKARDTVPDKQLYNHTDDYLETLVNSSYVVIPSPPPSPPPGPRLPLKNARASPRTLSKALFDPRRIGLRLGALTPAERRVLFIGALLVVGAAMALKSGKVLCVDGVVKVNGGDGLKRLWNGKWTLISSVVAAWGRGLP
ncbi:hypothetical protein JVT61DRAFT_15178 [Boletus reticuloceps]|uniref:Rab-GAP TBC domain-containing protein n=1 Tax=Boletus reticuloceps TaxID=495285 RepID=A0A8I2YT78_9AGAM|nr:hypothetical protein JVT61DRAFT_15178 [Boletus reticuloceps]